MISQYKFKVRQVTAELPEPIDRTLRTLITAEVDIVNVETPDLHNGEYNEVYVAKHNGTCIVKQGDKKPILTKSKRSLSVQQRMAIRSVNDSDGYYERVMPKIIARIEEVLELVEET